MSSRTKHYHHAPFKILWCDIFAATRQCIHHPWTLMLILGPQDYLVYVSHDAENLQFWLWLQDYTRRFYAAPRSEQVLSPPWYQVEAPQPYGNEQQQEPIQSPPLPKELKKPNVSSYEVNFDNIDPPMSPQSPQFDKQSFLSGTTGTKASAADSVHDANTQMGLKWQSCMSR